MKKWFFVVLIIAFAMIGIASAAVATLPIGGGEGYYDITSSPSGGGGDDDNLTVGAVNLTDSFGGATTVSLTVSPMGGDVGGAPTADPQSPAALFSDYIFNNSAGNQAGESPFQISGLGAAPFVDLYFYHTFQTGWRVTIPGVNETAFPGQGIFTSANTYYFKRVPVTDGAVTGTFGSGTAVICGLSVVSPLPQPFLKSASPSGGGAQPTASIVVDLQDYVTEVDLSSIRVLVAEAASGEPIRLLEEASRGVLLGRETFTSGRIGSAIMEAALKALEGRPHGWWQHPHLHRYALAAARRHVIRGTHRHGLSP